MIPKKLVAFVLTLVYISVLAFSYSPVGFVGKSHAVALYPNDGAMVLAPTPTPTPSAETIIDNYTNMKKGEWDLEKFGYGGSCYSTTKIGSTYMWEFKVPVDAYYQIKALIPEGVENGLVKYTVFCDGQYVDSFYNVNSKGNITLKKDYGEFMEFRKGSVVNVVLRAVTDQKCYADAMSFKRLEYLPTPIPTVPAGYSIPIMVKAEKLKSYGTVKENGYLSSFDDGDYMVVEDVLFSGFSGYDSLNIFSLNVAVAAAEGKTGSLEIRMDGLDGALIGTVDLKDTGDGLTSFSEQAFRLNRVDAGFSKRDIYIIYRGEGTINVDWVKFSQSKKTEPGQSELLEEKPSIYKICGYVKAGFDSENSMVNEGFKIEKPNSGIIAITDSNGYFEADVHDVLPTSLKIWKDGYLDRIVHIEVYGKTVISTEDKPIEMWPGDIIKDKAINMMDVIDMAKAFNCTTGDELYSTVRDFNLDEVINIADIVIVAQYFGKTTNDY
ncbi:MAG TPA: carbohydrate-binding protein [Pseudobacteroides sp.]|nr:carbohydrate-binding protein [Pseudobacteroides sp.]